MVRNLIVAVYKSDLTFGSFVVLLCVFNLKWKTSAAEVMCNHVNEPVWSRNRAVAVWNNAITQSTMAITSADDYHNSASNWAMKWT